MPPRHLLLDLDGTLLGIDVGVFAEPFFRSAAAFLEPHIEPEATVRGLQAGFRAMGRAGRDGLLLAEVFAGAFAAATGLPRERVGPLFDDYYRAPFAELGRFARPLPGAKVLLAAARSASCTLVLATKPVFPMAAITARLAWGGLEGEEFRLVTASDTMRSCKPALDYWLEVLETVGAEPGECLMAGNDRRQDLSAAAAGIPVFLVDEGYLVDSPPRDLPPHPTGTLADLAALITNGTGKSGT